LSFGFLSTFEVVELPVKPVDASLLKKRETLPFVLFSSVQLLLMVSVDHLNGRFKTHQHLHTHIFPSLPLSSTVIVLALTIYKLFSSGE